MANGTNGGSFWSLMNKNKGAIAFVVLIFLLGATWAGFALAAKATNKRVKVIEDERTTIDKERKSNADSLLLIQERQGVIQTQQTDNSELIKENGKKLNAMEIKQATAAEKLDNILKAVERIEGQ